MRHGRKVILRSRGQGIPQADSFEIVERADPPPQDGEVAIDNLFLSVEPAMRGWICDTGNYAEPLAIGSVMRSLAVGRVAASRVPDIAEDDLVLGWFGWQESATVPASAIIRRVPETALSPSLALGILGINGVTAHLAMTGIGRPRNGETVVVSTAAGSVGSAAGQIAKQSGARTVGITSGPVKIGLCLDAFGYDAAIDYRDDRFEQALEEACPQGIDVYFDNTAGRISDAVLARLAVGARVVVCGTASIDRWSPWPTGPRVERHLLVKRASMQGFVIFDHLDRWEKTVAALADDVAAGRIAYREDILEGLEACPDAIAGLYRGENLGKRVIRL